MNYGVLLVSLIGFLALTGMVCILIDTFLTRKNNPTIAPKIQKRLIPTMSTNFMEDFDSETFSIIIKDEDSVS